MVLVVVLATAGCGDSSEGGSFAYPSFADNESGDEQPRGVGEAGGGEGAADSDAPPEEEPFVPEEEDDFRFQAPAASHTFVFVVNTDLNAVARINSLTLQIDTIEVGLEPTIVRTTLLGDVAVVLNEGSDDVSIIEHNNRVTPVDVLEGANSLVLTPNADFAIAYYDDAIAEATDVAGSLSDATLVRLDDARAFNLAVGFHIREIEFSADGEVAYFVTDDGVAPVNMGTVSRDVFVPPVPLTYDRIAGVSATDREVDMAAGGDFALVRNSTEAALRLVDMADGRISELVLDSIPTDLDLLPSGDEVVAVLRGSHQVALIPLPGGFENSEEVTFFDVGDEVVGLAQLIPNSRLVALYSTLNENDHLSILDLEDGTVHTIALRKGIEGVHPSPDGGRLLVFHTKVPGEPVPGTADYLAKSFAYTVFNLDSGTSRLIVTDARPGEFTFSEDGSMAFILQADRAAGVRAVEWVDLLSGRDVTIEFRRLPESLGVIPATGRIYVSEEHEVGRMAFINTESGEVREVTGYHLNSRTE
jgi:DNA-binding beta-propeller fold protein YncE